LLEKEQDRLNALFKRVASQYPTVGFFQQNPIQGLEQLRLKVKNELNNKVLKVVGTVLKDNQREKLTITDINDLRNEVEIKPYVVTDPEYATIPVINEECQTVLRETQSTKVQTDLKAFASLDLQTDLTSQDIEKMASEIASLKAKMVKFMQMQNQNLFRQMTNISDQDQT